MQFYPSTPIRSRCALDRVWVPCNFTSAKPTVQHSENLFEFENHVISSSSKPNSGVFSSCTSCLSTLQFYLLPNPQSAFESIHAFENPVISFSSRTYGQLCMTASLFENPAISSWIYRCFSWLGLVLRVRLNFCIVWTSLACGFATFNQKQSMFLHLSVLQSFIFSK